MRCPQRLLPILLVPALASVACGDAASPETATTAVSALVSGAPRIVATSIDAPFVAGRYQLLAGKTYTATVVVDAGTITYLTRVEAAGAATAAMTGGQHADDTVVAYAGRRAYTLPLTASATGDAQVAFQVRDRGTGNVYDVDGGVAATVSSAYAGPRIASTTIAAPLWKGRYQLVAGQAYDVTVVVAMSNVTYAARVEGSAVAPSLHLAPSASSVATMPRFGADQTYHFTVVPSALGDAQLAFQLRDAPPPVGTNNAFAPDGGVAVTVNDPALPRIVSTSIAGVTPVFGQYVLTLGKRYDLVAHVVPGSVVYDASVEVRSPALVPSWANLHAPSTDHVVVAGPTDYHFAITPTDVGTFSLDFQMRDRPKDPTTGVGTDSAFNPVTGITIVGASPDAPRLGDLYGTMTSASTKRTVAYGSVTLDTGAHVYADGSGNYAFSDVPAGPHAVYFSGPSSAQGLPLYAPTVAVNVSVPPSGLRVDADLEEPFTALASAGMPYTRYLDYARGRAILHTVRVTKQRDHVEVTYSSAGGYQSAPERGRDLGNQGRPPGVLVNGGYFDYPCAKTGSYVAVGWDLVNGPQRACALGGTDPAPTLGIAGTGTNQTMQIRGLDASFAQPEVITSSTVLWSGVDYALQTGPWLVRPPEADGTCAAGFVRDGDACLFPEETPGSLADSDAYWARTAAGIAPNGDLFLVVADGEGLNGRQGANMSELAQFFRHVLGATTAMNFDGGGSSQMAVYSESAGGYRLVNTLASEHSGDGPMTRSPVLDFVAAF